jgi:hypothetical protein
MRLGWRPLERVLASSPPKQGVDFLLQYHFPLHCQESARALGVISSEVCPVRAQSLLPPFLGKILAQLKRLLAVRV